MDAEQYTRSVVLLCPTCGCNTLQELTGAEGQQAIRCPSCGRTMSKDELIRENGPNIDAALDDMKKEVVEDVRKEIHDALKKVSKGSNTIKMRI